MQSKKNKSEEKENVLVKIYELRDPRDLECKPRYIGITIRKLNKRLSCHLTPKELNSNTHKNNWIKSLLKNGIKPTIHLMEEIIGWDYACEVEKYYIKEFKEQGYDLTNSTTGGDGMFGYIRSEQQIKNFSLKLTGHKTSEETKEKIRLSNLNVPKPTLWRAVIQYDLNNNFIKEWNYIGLAARELNIDHAKISRVLAGKRKSTGGYKWKYKIINKNE